MRKLTCVLFLSVWWCIGYTQQDSSFLRYDQLELEDLDFSSLDQSSTKVIAGTRNEQDLADLPFTVFVITAKEIREQGYYTLVDALKNLPGIRVSQPGSGLDGETFMMRGLYGNTYAKILINDIPIRPSVVGAMPIGSQLPIRQAERIEVIYGPAATIYGPDAAAGVINIILKDSEYPTFAQADIEIGKNNLTRLSALFGGKFSLGRNILKVRMFGGYTSMNDREIKYDLASLYNPQQYEDLLNLQNQELIQYEDKPNFEGATGVATLSSLPHQSNYVGFSATMGIFEFSAQRMFRSDHSSIGLNPFAVSYADPQSLIGEEILSTHFSFKKEFKKWDLSVRMNRLSYSINPLSSYKYVLPLFGTFSNGYGYGFLGPVDVDPSLNVGQSIDSLYLSGSRYVSGSFNDVSVELQSNFKLSKAVNISFGITGESGNGDAIERFLKVPVSTVNGISPPPFSVNPNATFSSVSSYMETYLKFGKISAIAGVQSFIRSDGLLVNDPVFNPRVGVLYKASPEFSIRASYSQAFRYPSAYFNNSSYTIQAKDGGLEIETGSPGLEPEETINVETGLRYNPSENLSLDFSMYYTQTSDFIDFDIVNNTQDGSFFWGFENDPNSFTRLMGAQVSLRMRNIIPSIQFGTDVHLNYSKGKERLLQLFFDDILETEIQELPVVRAQPNLIGHVRMSFVPVKNLTLFLNHSFMSNSWTRNKLRITGALQNNNVDSLINNGYYTLGIRSQFKISRQIDAFADFANLTNIRYGGIDATVDFDSLLYNPQPSFMFKMGVNFAFN
ncbi:MAG: TonB-dependent receptor [Saprospiraceae bacterium]|nr:TonB-dependent receptor [Saprospiraceae bacterium]